MKNCNNDPDKLQRLLFKAIKGDDYIAQHSALGQKSNTGFPAVDKDLLKAVDRFPSIFSSSTSKISNKQNVLFQRYDNSKKINKNPVINSEFSLYSFITVFVKSKFPDAEPQRINKTFNELASNLRVKRKRKEGKLQQSKNK